MHIFKVGLVMAAGLGSTWAAREAGDALFGSAEPAAVMLAADTPADPAKEPPADSAKPPPPDSAKEPPVDSAKTPPTVPEVSREEMEAEIRRAQAQIAGKPAPADVDEFKAAKPLPADIGIALPSDI